MKTSCFSYASLETLPTATRLHNSAQGCRAATTLGTLWKSSTRNPDGVATNQDVALTQRSRIATTLGFVAQPLRGWRFLFLILALSAPAFAQNFASITGRVSEQHNAVVAGAQVRLRPRSGVQLITVTDSNGTYSFNNLVSGDYVIEVEAKGFANFASNEINVHRGQSIS